MRTSESPSRLFDPPVHVAREACCGNASRAAADEDAQFMRFAIQSLFRAPITEVVMPDECQSMPRTDPNA